jgi:hypothetical protein
VAKYGIITQGADFAYARETVTRKVLQLPQRIENPRNSEGDLVHQDPDQFWQAFSSSSCHHFQYFFGNVQSSLSVMVLSFEVIV